MRGCRLAGLLALLLAASCEEKRKQPLWHDDDREEGRPPEARSSASAATTRSGSVFDLFGGDDREPSAPPSGTSSAFRPSLPRRMHPARFTSARGEACLAAAKMAELAREHYLESLKGAPPSATASPAYLVDSSRHGSCRLAVGTYATPVPSLDSELAALGTSTETVERALLDSEKAFKGGSYRVDDFAGMRNLHDTLVKEASVRARRESAQRAFDAWLATSPAPEPAGSSDFRAAVRDYMAAARVTARLLEATPVDGAALTKSADVLAVRSEKVATADVDPGGRSVRNAIDRFTKSVLATSAQKPLPRDLHVRALEAYVRLVDSERMSKERENRTENPRALPPP